MALHVPKAPGMAQMLKEGARVSAKWFFKNYLNIIKLILHYHQKMCLIWIGHDTMFHQTFPFIDIVYSFNIYVSIIY